MPTTIDPKSAKAMISGPEEMAFLDVREAGQNSHGHPLLIAWAPYSRLEAVVPYLAPRRPAPTVLVDENDGVAGKAAGRLEAMGYSDVRILEGGVRGWSDAGLELFKGENALAKGFAEWLEKAYQTPTIYADELSARLDAGEDIAVLDCRTPDQFRDFHIPGGISCPGAEGLYRLRDIVSSPETLVVVHCQGRTRGLMWAQTLINAGVPNKVMTLFNGTPGWLGAGLSLETGNDRPLPTVTPEGIAATRAQAERLRDASGVPYVDRETLRQWRRQSDRRTLYMLDVRTPEEYRAGHIPGSAWAISGQLAKGPEYWVAVRGARVVLVDDTEVRAIATAHWLLQLGTDNVYVLEGGIGGEGTEAGAGSLTLDPAIGSEFETMSPRDVHQGIEDGTVSVIDVGRSMDFREAHVSGARWACRAHLEKALKDIPDQRTVVLVSTDPEAMRLAGIDVRETGRHAVALMEGGLNAWRAAGLPVDASPDAPADEDCIDFSFLNTGRLTGNQEHTQKHLDWKASLPQQIEADGDVRFRIPAPAAGAAPSIAGSRPS